MEGRGGLAQYDYVSELHIKMLDELSVRFVPAYNLLP